MMRICLLAALCAIFAGCATNKPAETSGAKAALTSPAKYEETGRFYLVSRTNVRCRKARRTGTHFLTWSCTSKEQEENEFNRTQAALQKRMRNQGF